jgi:DNA-directed RNA polymerase II subunit RPB2
MYENTSQTKMSNNDLFDIEVEKYIEAPWDIIKSYFKDQYLERLVRHQLESYNNFVNYQIMKTIEMFNPIHIKSENDYDHGCGKYSLEVFLTLENFHIYRPQIHENNGAIKLMFPQEARLRNFTYASSMTVDVNVKYIIRDGENLENTKIIHKTLPNIPIGKLPIMVKSNICVLNQYKHIDSKMTGECKYCPGGYFIINGSEKTVLGQERAAENKVYVFNISKNNPKYTWTAEIKSVPDFKCISPKQINLFISSKNNGFGCPITIQIPRIKQTISLFVLFRALNIISDKEICEYILLDISQDKYKPMLSILQASIIEANKYMTYEDAIKHIQSHVSYTPINMDKETGAQKKHQFTLDILQNDLFPHCQTLSQKAYFLGYMTNKLLQASFEWIMADDRDSYINKRVDLTGTSLNNLFRNHLNRVVKDIEKQTIKEINTGSWRSTEDYENILNLTNIYKIVKSNTIENGFKRALSTGDFGIKNVNSNKVGVAQVLNRLTYVATLSHLRRISTPTDKSGKLVPPRKLHNTTWGFICPAETPEGGSVGIVKNMSYLSHITIYSDSTSLYEYVKQYIIELEKLKLSELFNKVKVFINGSWLGISEEPQTLYNLLKDMKTRGIINIYTSIVFDYKCQEIRICNDSGRITRPVLRVKDNSLLLTNNILNELKNETACWDELLTNSKFKNSVIEYIDPEEQSYSMIAIKPKDLIDKKDKIYRYTHCEIHPSTIFGVVTSCIPFPEHNQSPRNTYQGAQAKQAMGVYTTNFDSRMDKTAYVQTYPTRPLVDTRVMNLIKINEIPSGCNINVAIMTHTGYNQEDSVLINKGSIDRGLFQITLYHTEKDEDKQKINGDEEIRCKPDPNKTKGMKYANYNKVNSKGVVPENTLIENRDVIIAKVAPIKENRNDHTKIIKYEDQSKTYRTVEETYIDKNFIDRNGDGYNFAKVRLRALRKPVIGDKFSSRHGQKGTVGNIIPEEDMPFTKNGVRPDIIINPHAIPSRMTIGQLKETLLGKVLVELGLFGDGTSFGEFEVSSIADKLLELGYEAHGNELMYNGLTGEQIEANVFLGPVFYQRLKHMVYDKAHSRSIGPMVNLTRQPAEGRSRDGGLRFGEMERDCFDGNTPIVTTNGVSILIKNMNNFHGNVLGWDEKTDKMIPSKKVGFLYKGQRECVKITYEDGRTNVCTPEHPILVSNGDWIKAQELQINSRVKSSLNYTVADFDEEIKECNGWSLRVGDLLFKTDNQENYIKTLVIAKLIGYLVTDGTIYKKNKTIQSRIYLSHMIDVTSMVNDIQLLCKINQTKFKNRNSYFINIPNIITTNILKLNGIILGKKINQPAQFPEFILDPNCPKPIIREFLGGLFGANGNSCILTNHRGKRNLVTSVSFSKSKTLEHLESLAKMLEDIKYLFSKFDITNINIQNFKQTTSSKEKINDLNRSYQLTLQLSIEDLIPFSEKIGFRYCYHKSQRLEAGVSYNRLRNEVIKQNNWIVNRVNELTNFQKIKEEFPNKNIQTKQAIIKAVEELKQNEPLIHEYAIPSAHDISNHFVKRTQIETFGREGFPTAEEYFREIGAINWFINDIVNNKINENNNNNNNELTLYGVNCESQGLPTMNLKVIDIRPAGVHPVYDIEVENTHSFLANGIVAHNCMVSHGASRFTRGRLYDASDKYSVYVCKKCGLIASYNDELHIHHCRTCENRTDFAYVEIPYACKLLFQELTTMNVVPRIMTE